MQGTHTHERATRSTARGELTGEHQTNHTYPIRSPRWCYLGACAAFSGTAECARVAADFVGDCVTSDIWDKETWVYGGLR